MSIIDGQPVDATASNAAWVSKNTDDQAQGKIDFSNSAPESGPTIFNIQRNMNAIYSFVGGVINQVYNILPSWASNIMGSGDSVKQRVEAIDAAFSGTTGHAHTGADGQGPMIASTSLSNVPLRGYVEQGTDLIAVTGSSSDVTTPLSGKVASGGDTSPGVVVIFPNNKIVIRQASGASENDSYTDLSGHIVFGRLTFSSGTFTLSYFVDISGTETPYTFAASDVRWYYQELFNPMANPPIYSEFASIPSDSSTSDVVDASATQRGLVSTGVQSFAGAKDFVDATQSTTSTTGAIITAGGIGAAKNINAGGTVLGSNLSGTNTGDVSLAAFGGAPSANGATLSGQAITLQPADATHPGGISIVAQVIAGSKDFTDQVQAEKEFIVKQIATPTNPSAGYDKLYVKSDDNLYIKTSAGVEKTVGGGTITGPGSTTNNDVVRWDGTSGTAIKDSNVSIDDFGVTTINYNQASSYTPIIIINNDNQTTPGIEWQPDTAGNNMGLMFFAGPSIVAKIRNNGVFETTSAFRADQLELTTSGLYTHQGDTNYPQLLITETTGTSIIAFEFVAQAPTLDFKTMIQSTITKPSNRGLIIQAAASQTGNLLEFRDSTGAVIGAWDYTGNLQGQTQASTPSNPPSGFLKLYFKTDGNLYMLNSSGTETQVNGGGGGGATTALDNLTTTNINASLLFNADSAYDIGSTLKKLDRLFTVLVNLGEADFYDTSNVNVGVIRLTPSWLDAEFNVFHTTDATTPATHGLGLGTGPQSGANNSRSVIISSGSVVDGTSADVIVQSGPVYGTGMRGKVQLDAERIKLDPTQAFYKSDYIDSYWETEESAIVADSTATSNQNAQLFIGTTDLNVDSVTYSVQMMSGYNNSTTTSGIKTGGAIVATGYVTAGSGSSGDVEFFSGDTEAGPSGGVLVSSGNSNSGGNSGGILLQIGTSSATRGKIKFQDGTEGTSGYVWTSIDTVGSGSWSPAGNNFSKITTSGSTPTATPGTGGGTAPTASLVSGSTNLAGQIQFSSDTDATSGDLVHVTYSTPFTNGSFVVFTNADGTTANVGKNSEYYVTSSTTEFVINAFSNISVSTAYTWNYIVVGY